MADIDDLAVQFRDNRARASALAAPLSHEQFNWRASPGSWSVGECLAHLAVSARAVESRMRPAIAEARARGLTGSGPFRYGWFSRWFESEMEPPPRRRLKAPPVFAVTPGTKLDNATVLGEFDAAGKAWLELLELSRGLDLARAKTVSPANRLLRFPLGAYFRINAAHERRHLWQAEQVARAPGFPPG